MEPPRPRRSPPGLSPLATWNHLRPDFVESEAQQRAAFLASVAGASMYAVHVTNAQTLDVLTRQRDRYPHILLETCPHYLTHDIDSELGPIAKVNPPLRTAADREALWRAIGDGRINVIGSDHVPRHGRPSRTTSGRRAPASRGWRPCSRCCSPRGITGAAFPCTG